MRRIFILLIAAIVFIGIGGFVHAQTQIPSFAPDEYFVARILSIEDGRTDEILGANQQFLNIKILLLSGPDKGSEMVIEDEDRFTDGDGQGPQVGDRVVIVKIELAPGDIRYQIDDHYRLPALGWMFALFLGLVIFFGRKRGAGAILGLTVSIVILFYYLLPRLLGGENPFFVTLIGAFIIALFSILLAHGFNQRTIIALGSTLITLVVSVLLADFFVRATKLLGMGSEEAFYLQVGGTMNFDLRGLLLGGIIIGMLGILDDVTTAQSATVEELKKANGNFSFRELYYRGLSVGKEHIASLVNTLVLAYVGASLPLFLLFKIRSESMPSWVLFNSEFIAEEVVRALAGSMALVLAVPISTFLAARFFSRRADTNHSA